MIKTKPITSNDHILIIGSSTGGPRALLQIIPQLPASLPTSILVVQHILPKFIPVLIRRLQKEASLKIEEAREGEVLKKGRVYLSPGDRHLELTQKDDLIKIVLNQNDPVLGVRPSVNLLLFSAVNIFGGNILTVILTGMGQDGFEGAKKVRSKKGVVMAESAETCMIYGMPKAVIEGGAADLVVPLYHMPQEIIKYFTPFY